MGAHPPDRQRGPRGASLGGTSVQLLAGVTALAVAAVAGLAFIHRPGSNRLDIWGYAALPADSASGWAHDLVTVGSLSSAGPEKIATYVVTLAW